MAVFLYNIHRRAEALNMAKSPSDLNGRLIPEEKFREADVVSRTNIIVKFTN